MTGVDSLDAVRPTDLAGARDAMLDRGRDRALLIRGAGTKLDWGAPARRTELVVDTTGLDGLLTHDAADATATVQAGMPLSRLQAELARAGQWLAIDPPHEGATVGGIFAANDTGPRRLRYGSMRDLVIGATVVTSDGEVARSGGKVIKNVAGYDLAKLLCGSLGTLALVAELVVRLHPLPSASLTVSVTADAATATRLAVGLLASPIVVSAVEWVDGSLHVRIEGRDAGVAQQTRELTNLLQPVVGDVSTVEGDEEAALWRTVAEGHAGVDGETVVRATSLPDRFDRVAAAFQTACAETGADATFTSSVGLGLHTARLRGDDPTAHAAAVRAWRRRVEPLGGSVVVRRRHPALTDTTLIWGPEPSAAALMRAVKQRLDPADRCAPGRFVAGI